MVPASLCDPLGLPSQSNAKGLTGPGALVGSFAHAARHCFGKALRNNRSKASPFLRGYRKFPIIGLPHWRVQNRGEGYFRAFP
jgi:hypothetical protein